MRVYYRSMTLSMKEQLSEQYGSDIWSTDEGAKSYRSELKTRVWNGIAEDYAVLAAVADYLPERSLNDKDIQTLVEQDLEEIIEAVGGKTEFKNYLSSVFMTEHLMEFHLAKAHLESELTESITLGTELESTETFSRWLSDGNLTRIRQIIVSESNRSLADDIRQSLIDGKTPEEAVSTIPEESASLSGPFYLVRGMAEDSTLEEEAFRLSEVGEVSQISEADNGYRILIKADNQLESFLTNQASAFLKRLREIRIAVVLSEYQADVSFEPNEYGLGIDLLTIE